MKKFTKVYKAPGYPIDPKLQLEREMVQVPSNHIVSGYDVVIYPDVAYLIYRKPISSQYSIATAKLTLNDIKHAMEMLAKDVDEDSPLPPWPHGMGNIT